MREQSTGCLFSCQRREMTKDSSVLQCSSVNARNIFGTTDPSFAILTQSRLNGQNVVEIFVQENGFIRAV
jgi:hypothetical protein